MNAATPLSRRRTIVGTVLALIAGTALAVSAPLGASAHVSASATSTAAGSYTVVTINVPHGVEEESTTIVTIDIPESIISVTPTVNPNWTISKTLEPLEPPVEDNTERVAQVIYTAIGDGLPTDQRDTFELSLRLPDGAAGDVIGFAVTQTSPTGATVVWEGDEVPSITITAAEGDGDGHGGGESHSDGHSNDGGHSDGTDAELVAISAPMGGQDILARALGGVGLLLGAIALVIAVLGRRSATAAPTSTPNTK